MVNDMRTWSVEHEANSWNDDLFNGTYDECIAYCNEKGYKIDGVECRLAEVEVDERGSVIDTYSIVDEI
ncbi:MAG: hypothetical protein NC434_11010 [Ruminococcus sp.]|nr:hypothetical protein [Ruminococcus sp.]